MYSKLKLAKIENVYQHQKEHLYFSHTNFCKFSTYIFSTDITPEMLKLGRVTKSKVFFLVLVYIFNIDLFEFLATTLEKGVL